MKLIIGLGNPGKKYEKTRHNVGFMAVDKIASNFKFPHFSFEKKFNADISKGSIDGTSIILAKPQTFMNNSGLSAKVIMDYYKIQENDLIVIHDDLDIIIGNYKNSKNRNSAGHKGVQSIIDRLNSKNFERIRIGAGIENKDLPTEIFVLENFNKSEISIINGVIEKICGQIKERVQDSFFLY